MLKLQNMEEFSREIERLVNEQTLSYIEATVEHLTKIGVDPDNSKLKNLLSPKILQKIYDEAIEYNMMGTKKKKKLPLK